MRKIRLLELNVSVIKEIFVTFKAGIWQRTMSVNEELRATSPIETIFSAIWDETLPNEPIDIGSVTVDKIIFTRVSSLSDLYLTDPSWFFDPDLQILYISFTDYKNTNPSNVYSVGEKLGLASESQNEWINGIPYPVNSYYNGFLYEPRLLESRMSTKVDDQKNGIFVFDDLSASIINTDGEFDNIRESITGNDVQLLIADISESQEEEIETGFPYKQRAEYSDFHIVRKGILESVDYTDPDRPSLQGIDIRSDWDQKIGENLLTVAEFPNLEDKYIDKRKPVCIGKVNGAKCIQLQANLSVAGNFDYLICDTSFGAIQSVSAVYFDGELGSGDVDGFLSSGYSIDLETGILTISNCKKGKVWVYGVFTPMNETVEIMLYLLNRFANLAYLDVNFNQAEIEEIQALDYQTHVYIDEKGKKLSDVIEKLVLDIQCDFFQQGDVFTLRQSNDLGEVVEEIPDYQIVDNPPGWDDNRIETVKTISVSYDPDYREDISPIWYDDSLEEIAIDNKQKPVDRTFETNLVSDSNVQSIYSVYYSRFVNEARVVKFSRTTAFEAKLTDFIIFRIVRRKDPEKFGSEDKQIFQKGIYKIIEIDENSDSITAVYFADYNGPDYLVEWDANPENIYEWDANPMYLLEAN